MTAIITSGNCSLRLTSLLAGRFATVICSIRFGLGDLSVSNVCNGANDQLKTLLFKRKCNMHEVSTCQEGRLIVGTGWIGGWLMRRALTVLPIVWIKLEKQEWGFFHGSPLSIKEAIQYFQLLLHISRVTLFVTSSVTVIEAGEN